MSTEPDDASLALRWQQGEKAAGELLYRRYFPTVLNYFRNKVGDAERGDLVADTFLRGQRGLQTFRGDASFKTFILKIAHNTLVDHYRRRANERKHADARDRELSAQDLARSPFSLIADSQQARLLLEALRRLPHELQELLELRFWEEPPERGQGAPRAGARRARQLPGSPGQHPLRPRRLGPEAPHPDGPRGRHLRLRRNSSPCDRAGPGRDLAPFPCSAHPPRLAPPERSGATRARATEGTQNGSLCPCVALGKGTQAPSSPSGHTSIPITFSSRTKLICMWSFARSYASQTE